MQNEVQKTGSSKEGKILFHNLSIANSYDNNIECMKCSELDDLCHIHKGLESTESMELCNFVSILREVNGKLYLILKQFSILTYIFYCSCTECTVWRIFPRRPHT